MAATAADIDSVEQEVRRLNRGIWIEHVHRDVGPAY